MTRIKSFFFFARAIYRRYKEDEVWGLSAEFAYFFLLSLFPLLIAFSHCLSYLPFSIDDVLSAVEAYAPGDTIQLIRSNIHSIIGDGNKAVISVSLLFTLYFASNALNSLMRAFNRSYGLKETRNQFVVRLISMLLTITMIFLVIFVLIMAVFGQRISEILFEVLEFSDEYLKLLGVIRWLVSVFILFIVFITLYYFGPCRRLHIKQVLPGALFATFGWIIVSVGFATYVDHFGNYAAKYGSLSGIIIMLVWFFLSGLTILVGSELNAELMKNEPPPTRGFIPLKSLLKLRQRVTRKK